MIVQNQIESKLADSFELLHLEVLNESGGHNVPPGSESHFKVVLVSPEFEDVGLLARHRRVNEVLATELAGSVHALAIHTYTDTEWRDRFGETPMSPPCLGGGLGGGPGEKSGEQV
ncbi:MAG: BolA/IbaG family iron-sulfur metabolism protein [Gammaproteobacteria bacterium]|nr:BolA/IbaG family iron-sulfur metabolism protein [Gammaproteobacteria bacterium]